MTENESRGGLSRREREFVGIGASVGAGCHPCVTHHLKAGAEAGLDAPVLLAAITAAERVSADASARMAQHARRQLPATVGSAAAQGTIRDATLAALGAAAAANSMPNIERYLSEAAELGVSHDELVDAVSVAHEVQANAARIHARRTDKLLETPPVSQAAATPNQAEECEPTCPCHDEDGRSGGGAGSATRVASAGEAPPAAPACSDAIAGKEEPPADNRRPSPGTDEAVPPETMMAGSLSPQAMFAACCGELSA